MKITELFESQNITIDDYLKKYINELATDYYIKPTDDMFEPVENYDGMSKGFEMLIDALTGRKQLGTHYSFVMIDEMEEGDNN